MKRVNWENIEESTIGLESLSVIRPEGQSVKLVDHNLDFPAREEDEDVVLHAQLQLIGHNVVTTNILNGKRTANKKFEFSANKISVISSPRIRFNCSFAELSKLSKCSNSPLKWSFGFSNEMSIKSWAFLFFMNCVLGDFSRSIRVRASDLFVCLHSKSLHLSHHVLKSIISYSLLMELNEKQHAWQAVCLTKFEKTIWHEFAAALEAESVSVSQNCIPLLFPFGDAQQFSYLTNVCHFRVFVPEKLNIRPEIVCRKVLLINQASYRREGFAGLNLRGWVHSFKNGQHECSETVVIDFHKIASWCRHGERKVCTTLKVDLLNSQPPITDQSFTLHPGCCLVINTDWQTAEQQKDCAGRYTFDTLLFQFDYIRNDIVTHHSLETPLKDILYYANWFVLPMDSRLTLKQALTVRTRLNSLTNESEKQFPRFANLSRCENISVTLFRQDKSEIVEPKRIEVYWRCLNVQRVMNFVTGLLYTSLVEDL